MACTDIVDLMVVVMIFRAMAQVWRNLLQRELSHWHKLASWTAVISKATCRWHCLHGEQMKSFSTDCWTSSHPQTLFQSCIYLIISCFFFYPLLIMINFDIWFNDYSALLLRIVGFTTSRKVVFESVFFCHSRPQIPETTLYYWFSAFEIRDSWSKRQPREFSRVTVWSLFSSCAWALSV